MDININELQNGLLMTVQNRSVGKNQETECHYFGSFFNSVTLKMHEISLATVQNQLLKKDWTKMLKKFKARISYDNDRT